MAVSSFFFKNFAFELGEFFLLHLVTKLMKDILEARIPLNARPKVTGLDL